MPTIKRGVRAGEKVSWKEWLALAKNGIANITPLQQAKAERQGLLISTFGVLCGIVVLAFAIKSMWWLEIVLIGGLIISGVQIIGNAQKVKAFKNIEQMVGGVQ